MCTEICKCRPGLKDKEVSLLVYISSVKNVQKEMEGDMEGWGEESVKQSF